MSLANQSSVSGAGAGAAYVSPIRLVICGQAFVPTFLVHKGPFQHIISISNQNGTCTPSQPPSGASSPITMDSSLISPPSPGSLSRLVSFGQMTGGIGGGGGDVSPCFPKEPSKLRVTLDNHCAHVLSMEFGDDEFNSHNTPDSPQQEHIGAILEFARVVKAHCVAMTASAATSTTFSTSDSASALASPPAASPSPTSAASLSTPSAMSSPPPQDISPVDLGTCVGAGLIVMPPAALLTSNNSSSHSCISSPRQSHKPQHNRRESMPCVPPGMSGTTGSSTPGAGPPKHRSTRMSRATSSASLGTSAIGSKPSVLVHCNGGTSRSPAVAIILLTALGDTPFQALKHVLAVQSSAIPNRKLLALAGITFTREEWSAARPPRLALPIPPTSNVVPLVTPVVQSTVSQVLSPGCGSPFQSPPPSASSSCSVLSSVDGSVFGTPSISGAVEAFERFPVGSPIPCHLLQDTTANLLGSPQTAFSETATSTATSTAIETMTAVLAALDATLVSTEDASMVDIPLNTPCAALNANVSGAGAGLHIDIPPHGRLQR